MPLTSSIMEYMTALVLKAQCIPNRCKDLFKWKKYFGVIGTLTWITNNELENIGVNFLR